MITRRPASRRPGCAAPPPQDPDAHRARQRAIFDRLGCPGTSADVETPAFACDDVTAGTENELQVTVRGARSAVDLPLALLGAPHYGALRARARFDAAAGRELAEIDRFLHDNADAAWDHSWVRIPRAALNAHARGMLHDDLAGRADSHRFACRDRGADGVRVPMSYALKLALADVLGASPALPRPVRATATRLFAHLTNDNTSPELLSLYVVSSRDRHALGAAVARENQLQFLLAQLLTEYANRKFALHATGQRASIYFAPTPGPRQRRLNACLPESDYRALMMNPCLSGFADGTAKQEYMHLCHRTLATSRGAVRARLRVAGLTVDARAQLPPATSLLNNGTHLSLGSRRLSAARRDPASGVSGADEKYLGDLCIKIVEHFLPLFVGTYSGAPFRLRLSDMHPGKALGFLPLELHPTHLKIFWRQWKTKAAPLLHGGFHDAVGRVFRLRGDYVPDFRLLDYFVALPGTHRHPALDGRPGNDTRLKQELHAQGVYHRDMSLYLPYRLRDFESRGFSGFEGRYYSAFEDFDTDLGAAAELQRLVTAVAYQLMATGRYTHADLPDDPFSESERRQILFAAAAGLPAIYVRKDTRNRLLGTLVSMADGVRTSRRQPAYLKVPLAGYRAALLRLLGRDAPGIVEHLDAGPWLDDLAERLADPAGRSAAGRLTRGILDEIGAHSPMEADAVEFNEAADRYYRDTLRDRMLRRAVDCAVGALRGLERRAGGDARVRAVLCAVSGGRDAAERFAALAARLLADEAEAGDVQDLIQLLLVLVTEDARDAERLKSTTTPTVHDDDATSLYRSGVR
ncbi:MAG TPA: hypothetical protein VGA00_08295 [Acidiferrobacterales bacterium]